MGHYVEYLLEMSGSDFLQALGAEPTGDARWEGGIPGATHALLGFIDGEATPLTLASVKYTWLVNGLHDAPRVVKDIDDALCRNFREVRILRWDEILLSEWMRLKGEDFYRAGDALAVLLDWLKASQDQQHWTLVSSGSLPTHRGR